MTIITAALRRHLRTLLLVIPIIALGAPPIAHAQEDEARAACGRKAKDAGVSGTGAVSAFVAECVAGMKASRVAGHDGSKKPKSAGNAEEEGTLDDEAKARDKKPKKSRKSKKKKN